MNKRVSNKRGPHPKSGRSRKTQARARYKKHVIATRMGIRQMVASQPERRTLNKHRPKLSWWKRTVNAVRRWLTGRSR